MKNGSELPWGCLPIEQYLIGNWNYSATESPAQQRLQLIREFLDLDEFPQEWIPIDYRPYDVPEPHRKPTIAEIDTILRPWRSHDLREQAWSIMHCNHIVPLFLRTYYSPDTKQRVVDDKKMEGWANAAELLSDEIEWAGLNRDLFNFGPDWQRVYEIMPEVAGPMDGSGRRKPEVFTSSLPQFKDVLRDCKKIEPDEWKGNPQRYIENTASCLQQKVTAAYILVADQEVFQSDYLRLLYVDYKLNIIRESRVEADGVAITDVIMDWDQTGLLPAFWEQGIGEKYRVDGELGAPLYQLNEEDWADP